MSKLVVCYRRVSHKEQGKSGLGLEAQAAQIHHFCEYNGLEIVADYVEVQSGGDDDRPQLARAFEHAKKAKAIVVVSKLDRLSRDAHFIMGLMKYGQKFVTVEDGLQCSELQLHLKAVVAQNERTMISQRTKAALAAKKARGWVPQGIKPGHDGRNEGNKLAISRSKAVMEAQAMAFAMTLKPDLDRMRQCRMTVNQIAAEWNERRVKTRTGQERAWHPATVTRLLKRLYGAEYKRFGRDQK